MQVLNLKSEIDIVSSELNPEHLNHEHCTISRELRRLSRDLLMPSSSQASYHIFQHVENNEKEINSLIQKFESIGLKVDKKAILDANCMHDILHHLNHQALGFLTKEALAADYTQKTLLQLGAKASYAEKVAKIILKTDPKNFPTNLEELIMRAADLAGIGRSYTEYRTGTDLLLKEVEIFSGNKPNLVNLISKQLKYLAQFIHLDLNVSPAAFTNEGKSIWHKNAIVNTYRMFNEVVGNVAEYCEFIDCSDIEKLVTEAGKNELSFIVIRSGSHERRLELLELANKIKCPCFVVPI